VDEVGHGLATRASRALTNVALAMAGITTVYIRCDEKNGASASVPRRLGFSLEQTLTRPPEAPGESGQLMIWARRFPIS
jgi:RimJ/RimL family protein N-acetyltransferase